MKWTHKKKIKVILSCKKKKKKERKICMQVKKQQSELDMEIKVWFQIGKGVHQGCILSPCLFNLYGEYIMKNARLNEAQAGIKTPRRNIITSDM